MLRSDEAQTTDESLMVAYQQGDLAAFHVLMQRYERPLWNFVRRFTADAAAAEDVLQETLMRLVKSAPRWRPDARFSTWLYTIARNLCTDHARRASLRRAASLDGHGAGKLDGGDSQPPLLERTSGGDTGAENAVLSSEVGARIERAIAALSEPQREVFLMREVLGMPFAEIASVLGENQATVKSRMRYALERLRAALAELRPDAHDIASESEGGPP